MQNFEIISETLCLKPLLPMWVKYVTLVVCVVLLIISVIHILIYRKGVSNRSRRGLWICVGLFSLIGIIGAILSITDPMPTIYEYTVRVDERSNGDCLYESYIVTEVDGDIWTFYSEEKID